MFQAFFHTNSMTCLSAIFSVWFILALFCVKSSKKGRFSDGRKLMYVSSLLLLSLWTFIIALYVNDGYSVELSLFTNSLTDVLQLFTVDATFSSFEESIVRLLYGMPYISESACVYIKAYVALIFIAAPVTGGVVLFDIISGIFPRFRLYMYSKFVWKEILYFSVLNEQSVALALSAYEENRGLRRIFLNPVIVFADMEGIDDDVSKEIVNTAKSIGAICVKEDITHLKLRKVFYQKIFLIDYDDSNNINVLTSLANGRQRDSLKNSDIYVFSADNGISGVADDIKKNMLRSDCKAQNPVCNTQSVFGIIWFDIRNIFYGFRKKYNLKFRSAPRIISINTYRNRVRNLLSEVPLYVPLIGRSCSELNVTIIGSGEICKEMFLQTYWCGQLLGYRLNINIVSDDSLKQFIDKIDRINPDILSTGAYIPSNADDNESMEIIKYHQEKFKSIMRIYPDSDALSSPYFTWRYMSDDVVTGNADNQFCKSVWEDGFVVSDSDYTVIDVGDDKLNMNVAEALKCSMAVSHMKEQDKHRIIAYVVLNSDLCVTANHRNKIPIPGASAVHVHAFGSMDEVFSVSNIYMKKNMREVNAVGDSYERLSHRVMLQNYEKTQYEYWAEMARAFHIRYKVFSSGVMDKCSFDDVLYGDDAIHKQFYHQYVKKIKSDENLGHRFSWLEHRRWCAFMRINGFRKPEDFCAYSVETSSHKNIELKLHPCLVECDDKGYRPGLFEGDYGSAGVDCLDAVSLDVYERLHKKVKDKLIDECVTRYNKNMEYFAVLEGSFWGRIYIKIRYGNIDKIKKKLESDKDKNIKKLSGGNDYKIYDYPICDIMGE